MDMNLLGAFPGGVPIGAGQQLSLLTVTGEGQVDVAPDTATVSLGATSRAPQAAAAFQQTAATVSRIVAALLGAGVPREQIQTSQIFLQPVFEDSRRVGFDATATVRVTLRDPSDVGRIIDLAVAAGANNVSGVSFELRNPGAAEARALALAVRNAQAQAAVLAQSLGVMLGPVFRVEVEPAQGPVVPVFARAAAAEAIPVLPGTVTVQRRVRVEFLVIR